MCFRYRVITALTSLPTRPECIRYTTWDRYQNVHSVDITHLYKFSWNTLVTMMDYQAWSICLQVWIWGIKHGPKALEWTHSQSYISLMNCTCSLITKVMFVSPALTQTPDNMPTLFPLPSPSTKLLKHTHGILAHSENAIEFHHPTSTSMQLLMEEQGCQSYVPPTHVLLSFLPKIHSQKAC